MKMTKTWAAIVLLITLATGACSKSDKSPGAATNSAKDISIGQEVYEGNLTFKFTEARPFTPGMQSSTQAAREKEPPENYHFKVKIVMKDSSSSDHILNSVHLIDVSKSGRYVGGYVSLSPTTMNITPDQEFTMEREVDSQLQDVIVFFMIIFRAKGEPTIVGPYRLPVAQ